jgi:two-component system, response regulator RegA
MSEKPPNVVPESASPLLIVDDDRVLRDTLSSAFTKRGFLVVNASNYDEALSACTNERPTRAIIDLRMPGKGGLELIPELLTIVPELRIVVLTGYGSIATALEAVRKGAIHYLQKPADVDDILAAFDGDTPAQSVRESEAPAPSLDRVEWEHIQRVLADCEGNISEAARRLGIHRRSLQRKLQRYAPTK